MKRNKTQERPMEFVRQKKFQGYRFYCPKYSRRIVETGNAKFIKNEKINRNAKPLNVEIQEIRMQFPLSITSSEVIVHIVVE